jgi:hypothetical protein
MFDSMHLDYRYRFACLHLLCTWCCAWCLGLHGLNAASPACVLVSPPNLPRDGDWRCQASYARTGALVLQIAWPDSHGAIGLCVAFLELQLYLRQHRP